MGFSNRGKYAEDKVHAYLTWWAHDNPHREASRLVDTKAAGRIIKAAKADFEYFSHAHGTNKAGVKVWDRCHGLIEVKQTEHDYRLERAKVTQLPTLRKRDKCGGRCYVVVYHSGVKAWRCLTIDYLANNGDKGSWDLRLVQTAPTCWEALRYEAPEVFVPWAK